MLQDPKWKLDNSEYTEQFDEHRREWYCLDCLDSWSNQDDDYDPCLDGDQCPYCRRDRVQELEIDG